MKLSPAKCPNCGANIEVNENLEKAICQYCGTIVLIQDAIAKYKVELSGKVEVEGIRGISKKLDDIRKYIAIEEYSQALQFAYKVIHEDEFNVEAHSLWLKSSLLLKKYSVGCFKENFVRDGGDLETIVKRYQRLKKFDDKEEYKKYLKDELPILDYIEEEYKKLVADEQKIDEYFNKINSLGVVNSTVIIVLSDVFGYSHITQSIWGFDKVPKGWGTTELHYNLQYYTVNRNGDLKCHYKSRDFDNYTDDRLYKPSKELTKEEVFANLERTIELLSNSKYLKLLQKLYDSKGLIEAIKHDKKRMLKKCGLN